MNKTSGTPLTSQPHRLVNLVGYLLILVVALRRANDLSSPFNLRLLVAIITLFLVLYASADRMTRLLRGYPWVYLVLQTSLVQYLGLFEEHQDTWALLYVVLAFQAARFFRRDRAFAWFGLFTFSILLTLILDYGLLSGLGRAVAYLIIGFVLVSYEVQYAQHCDALAESQLLLDELTAAHDQLDRLAGQTASMATHVEQERMIQALHESVGCQLQTIQRSIATARYLLSADPHQARVHIDDLQMKTQTMLSQMRRLIDEWRQAD